MQSQTTNSSPTAIPILDGERQVFGLLRRLFWTGKVAVFTLAIAVIALYVARQHAEHWVQHSREVGRIAREARVFATDRQTRIRGYLLTRDTVSLGPERRARVGLTAALDSLVGITADNHEQNDRARALRAAAVRWDQRYAQPLLSAPIPPPGPSVAALRDHERAGRELFDEFRRTSAEFLGAEDALYVARLRRDHLVDALSLLIVLLSTAALAIILRWMHRRVDGQTSELLSQQSQLEDQAVELEESTAEMEATNDELQEAAADLEIANDEMRASAAALARRDHQFSEAQRIARLGSWEYDLAASLNIWSDEMRRVLGQPLESVASLDTIVGQVVENDRARVKALFDRALSHGDSFSIECRIRWPNDTVHTVLARGAASRDETGRPSRIVGTLQDVTERRQLQDQLQQSQKMEAVGQLAGGVAHDFNNVLTAIKSFSELISLELPESSPLRDDVREITAAADRAAALTRHLLAFSRRQMLQPVVLDPNGVVEGVTKLLARLIGVDVHCETALAPDVGHVLADPGQLEQVVINLAVNARDAMPDGGTLTLETANVTVDQRHASRLSGVEAAEPGDYVVLTVSDTGEGMDRATQARIFEPFFTTKETGKGTGLGLSTVYGIVRQSGGYVSVYSEIGRGTTFRIYLPRVSGAVHVQAAKPVVIHTPNGKSTILLVDDDEAVRMVATRILTRAGYTVLTAASPAEAESAWADHVGPIHLLMTDLMMPGMNGGELATRLLESRKDTSVLYTSGYTNETVIRRGLIVPDVPFLAKPFTIDDVIRKVREALAN